MADNELKPAPRKLKRKDYEKALRKLQVELCHLQAWVILLIGDGRSSGDEHVRPLLRIGPNVVENRAILSR